MVNCKFGDKEFKTFQSNEIPYNNTPNPPKVNNNETANIVSITSKLNINHVIKYLPD